jgi:riboflavin biosynthesis pyrimidine reductase
VIGSPESAQTLIEHNLVDEYRFMIDPLIVGGGKRPSAMVLHPGLFVSSRIR